MTVAVGDIVRITAKLLLNNIDDIVNVYHFSVAVNNTLNDTAFMTEMASAMDTLYTIINANVHPLVSYSSVEGQNISKDELLPSRAWPILTVGTNSSEMIPEMCSPCVFHRTLKPRVRASKFLPPTGENAQIDGALVASAIVLLQAFGDSLTTGLTTTNLGLTYVAFNRLLSTSTVVTQALVPSRFRTQRRRRLGVGS